MASSKAKAAERAEKAAAALREQRRRESRRRTLMIGSAVLALVLIVGGGFLLNMLRDTSDEVAGAPAGESEYGVAIGDPDAPHEVVIYEDFLCPFCAQLEGASREDLAALADEGRVYVDYRPFNLLETDYTVAATNAFAVVLEQSGPEVAKEFHDALFEDQPAESGPYPDDDWLVEKAVEAGASETDVRPGIEDLTSEDWVTEATAAAQEAGVRGTPTILLDGEVFQDGRTIEEQAANLVEAVG